MDQDSFRRLLQTPRVGVPPASGPSSSRGSTGIQKKTIDASQPAFKPRKVKKPVDSKYRDRAAERRVGEGNDFAEVEAVLEDFNRRTADVGDRSAVEAQRKYLGGDGDHSVLVKGLDLALLEQNRSRAATTTEDDDSLEQAFLEATSAAPKKRTREDLIRELKEKRAGTKPETVVSDVPKTAEEEARLLEEAKMKGKFKPIGGSTDEKGKKKRVKFEGKDGERKKKKRKVQVGDIGGGSAKKGLDMVSPPPPAAAPESAAPVPPLTPEPEPPAEDFDIFANAGEYEEIDIGDDDEDEGDDTSRAPEKVEDGQVPAKPHAWIPTEETHHPNDIPPPAHAPPLTVNHQKPADNEDDEGELEPDAPMRLVPLASSAVPSIKDLLAMNSSSGGAGKRKKRKGKGGGPANEDKPKKTNLEAKADRDYKRLKSYTDKKAGASSAT